MTAKRTTLRAAREWLLAARWAAARTSSQWRTWRRARQADPCVNNAAATQNSTQGTASHRFQHGLFAALRLHDLLEDDLFGGARAPHGDDRGRQSEGSVGHHSVAREQGNVCQQPSAPTRLSGPVPCAPLPAPARSLDKEGDRVQKVVTVQLAAGAGEHNAHLARQHVSGPTPGRTARASASSHAFSPCSTAPLRHASEDSAAALRAVCARTSSSVMSAASCGVLSTSRRASTAVTVQPNESGARATSRRAGTAVCGEAALTGDGVADAHHSPLGTARPSQQRVAQQTRLRLRAP